MNLELDGKIVLVAGGSGLIGRAVVERLRQEGATAVPASRTGNDGLTMDARDQASVDAAFASLLDQYGRLDGLVVTAAPSAQTLDASRQGDPEQVLDAIDGKAMTFLRVANAALPGMTGAGYGRIVAISGQNALLTGNITGSVRNAALILTAKNLADAVAGTGVTVNTINPGTVTATPEAEVQPGRPGQSSPDQIADLAAFLLSPRTGTISGESIAIGHRVLGITSM